MGGVCFALPKMATEKQHMWVFNSPCGCSGAGGGIVQGMEPASPALGQGPVRTSCEYLLPSSLVDAGVPHLPEVDEGVSICKPKASCGREGFCMAGWGVGRTDDNDGAARVEAVHERQQRGHDAVVDLVLLAAAHLRARGGVPGVFLQREMLNMSSHRRG